VRCHVDSRAARARPPIEALRAKLDDLYTRFNDAASATDPIQIVRRFTRGDDREVAGFVAAALAFGRVAAVMQSIERVLAVAGPRPAEYVRNFAIRRERAALERIGHRWTRGVDLVALVSVLQQMLAQSGSIEGFFAEGHAAASADDIGPALDSFSTRALALDLKPAYGRVPRRPGVCYFFPRPSAGSGCKRLNLFLRWMVRRDALDLGVWSRVSPAKLIVPLDTHVIRVGRCLGLTRYTSPGWKMASEITASLRRIDPADPVKYDFALCHLGMTNACGFKRSPAAARETTLPADANCPLRGLCRPHARRPRRSPPPSDRP
jgi:uncharacterized protein (TIGR02757 family)